MRVNVHQKTLKTQQRLKVQVIHFNVAWIAPYKLDIKEKKNAISEVSIVLMLNIPLQKQNKKKSLEKIYLLKRPHMPKTVLRKLKKESNTGWDFWQ